MKKVILIETLNLKKKTGGIRKKINCTFIRINTSKLNYDADYEVSRIQTFISNFNKNKIKERDNKIKKTRRWNKKVKTSINKSKCLK